MLSIETSDRATSDFVCSFSICEPAENCIVRVCDSVDGINVLCCVSV